MDHQSCFCVCVQCLWNPEEGGGEPGADLTGVLDLFLSCGRTPLSSPPSLRGLSPWVFSTTPNALSPPLALVFILSTCPHSLDSLSHTSMTVHTSSRLRPPKFASPVWSSSRRAPPPATPPRDHPMTVIYPRITNLARCSKSPSTLLHLH